MNPQQVEFCLLCCRCSANTLTRVLEQSHIADPFISEGACGALAAIRALEERLRALDADLARPRSDPAARL